MTRCFGGPFCRECGRRAEHGLALLKLRDNLHIASWCNRSAPVTWRILHFLCPLGMGSQGKNPVSQGSGFRCRLVAYLHAPRLKVNYPAAMSSRSPYLF